MSPTTVPTPTTRSPVVLMGVACLILLVDGYDLFILGTVGPSLVHYEPWGATAATIGVLGSATALGMPFGSLFAGWAADRWGRRIPMALAMTWISVSMLAAALAPSLVIFGIVRFCTGIAIGALVPLVSTFVADHSPARRKTLYLTIALSSIGVGGLIAAITGWVLLPTMDFQVLFFPGVLPLLLVPIVWWLVPGGIPAGGPVHGKAPRNRFRQVLAPEIRRTTILFWVAMFMSLALLYSTTAWLPTVMLRSGYDLSSSLEFMIAFSVGALVGGVWLAVVADRGYLRAVTMGTFLLAAVALFVLSTPQPRPLLLLASALAGIGSMGCQAMVVACVTAFYPPTVRGTGLGLALAIGRLGAILGPILISLIASLSTAPRAPFFAFIAIAILGAIVITLLPRKLEPSTRPVAARAAAGQDA
jgi:MFS transporter, AAHS family, benzoate transport protein